LLLADGVSFGGDEFLIKMNKKNSESDYFHKIEKFR
jgi:hypothetical protein